MASQEFDVPPPGKFALMFLLAFGVIVPLIALSTVTLAAHDSKVVFLTAPLALIFPLVAGGIGWSIFRRKIRLVDKALQIGIFGWRRVPMSELDLANAAIVDLHRHPELHPTLKLAGTSMPGYRSGWFRLRDKRTAYLILSAWDRVLVVPKLDGKVLLFSPQRPEALLEAMRRAAG